MSIRIPYVEKDPSGELTTELVEVLSRQGGFSVDESGRYELRVAVLDRKEQKIGYRFDPEDLAQNNKSLILNESRAKTLARVEIVDLYTNKTVLGPAHILGSIEYDHQQNNVNDDIQRFSLGQLSDVDTISDIKRTPIYRDLARKICMWLQDQRDLIG